MGQLDRATVLPGVPLDALRKRIGGVADEYNNQAASLEYQPINTLRACNRRLRALPGNSIELPHALRKMTTGGVTHDDSNHAASREHQPIRTMNACNTRHRNRGNSTGELNSVPLNALRKRTGGVSNEDINQAAPGQLQPISALHARNMPGNSTGVLYCPVFHHTYALRKITGGVTDDEKKSSRKRGNTNNINTLPACSRRFRCTRQLDRATKRLAENNRRRHH